MTINPKAPVVQSKEIFIQASPSEIWKTLIDVEKWSSWNKRIKDPILEAKLEVGTTFHWKTNGSKIKSRIHTFQKNKALGWTGRTIGASAIHNWQMEPTNNGTRVTVEESMEGWLVALIKKKLNKIVEKDMLFWLEQLKKKCEK